MLTAHSTASSRYAVFVISPSHHTLTPLLTGMPAAGEITAGRGHHALRWVGRGEYLEEGIQRREERACHQDRCMPPPSTSLYFDDIGARDRPLNVATKPALWNILLASAPQKPGLLAMANSGKNSNTSQFFLTLQPLPQVRMLPCAGSHVKERRPLRHKPFPLQLIVSPFTSAERQACGVWGSHKWDGGSHQGVDSSFFVQPLIHHLIACAHQWCVPRPTDAG